MKLLEDYKQWKLYNNVEFGDFIEQYGLGSTRELLELCLKLKGTVEFSEEYFDRNSNVGGTSSEEFVNWKVCNDALKGL